MLYIVFVPKMIYQIPPYPPLVKGGKGGLFIFMSLCPMNRHEGMKGLSGLLMRPVESPDLIGARMSENTISSSQGIRDSIFNEYIPLISFVNYDKV
jgi:hypothetical protein